MVNPINLGIKDIVDQLRQLDFSIPSVIPSAITAPFLIAVLGILSILWLYGWLAVLENTFRGLIIDMRDKMADRTAMEQTSDAVAIGIYSLIWLPLLLSIMPLLALSGYIRFLMVVVERANPQWLGVLFLIILHLAMAILIFVAIIDLEIVEGVPKLSR